MTAPSRRPPVVLFAGVAWGGALHAIRTLHARGAEVYVAVVGHGADVYRSSRACAAAVDLTATEPDAIIAELRERIAEWVGDARVVVIPTSDRMAELLHRGRDAFLPQEVLAIAPPEVLQPLLDKVAAIEVAEAAGLDVPPWCAVATSDDVPAALELAMPVAVRPTNWWTRGTEPFKVARVDTPEALRALLDRQLAAGAQLVVQHYLDEPDDAVEFGLVWRSTDRTATAVVTGRKRRQATPDGGVMVWGHTVDLPDVRAAAERFLDASGFTGVGGIEVIRSGGRAWFIEFNPRVEAIHFLAIRAGVDLLGLLYDDLALGRPPRAPSPSGPAAAWVGSAALARARSGSGGVRVVLADRWAFQRSPGRVRAVWSWRDPRPAVAVVRRLARAARAEDDG